MTHYPYDDTLSIETIRGGYMTKEQAKKIAQRLRFLFEKSRGKEEKQTGQLSLDFVSKDSK